MTPDEWEKHIEAWRASGESQSSYCRTHRLKPGNFYSWKRRLQPSQTSDTFAVVKVKDDIPHALDIDIKIVSGGMTTISLKTPRELGRLTRAIELLAGV